LHVSINRDELRISIPVIIGLYAIIPDVAITIIHIYPAAFRVIATFLSLHTTTMILNFYFYHHFLVFLQI